MIFILIAAFGIVATDQCPGKGLSQKQATEQEWGDLKTRIANVSKEIEGLKDHEWAGIYKTGSWGSGSVLYIAPKAGFVDRPYVDYYPNNIVDQYDYGEVKVDNGRYLLKPMRGKFYSEIYSLKWGKRHFFIPDGFLLHFINEVNAGCDQFQTKEEVLQLYFYVRDGEQKAPLSGLPDLPAQFRGLILKQPVTAELIAVGEPLKRDSSYGGSNVQTWITNVKLNAGNDRGLWAGMELFAKDADDKRQLISVKVTDVSEHTAEAQMESYINDHNPPIPVVGWRLDSRLKESTTDTWNSHSVCW